MYIFSEPYDKAQDMVFVLLVGQDVTRFKGSVTKDGTLVQIQVNYQLIF